MTLRNSLMKLQNVVFLCSFSLLSVFAASCGGSSGSSGPGPEPGPGPDNGSANALSANITTTTSCAGSSTTYCFYDRVPYQQAQSAQVVLAATATASGDSVKSVNFETPAGMDASSCNLSSVTGTTTCKISYLPPSLEPAGTTTPLSLTYSYLNNLNTSANGTLSLTTHVLPLSSSRSVTLPKGITLANVAQVSFNGGLPTTAVINNNFFPDLSNSKTSVSNVASYDAAPFQITQGSSTVILTNNSDGSITAFDATSPATQNFTDMASPAPQNFTGIEEGDMVQSYTIDSANKVIYLGDDAGNVYSATSLAASNKIALPSPAAGLPIQYMVMDNSLQTLYTLSLDYNSSPYKEYLCILTGVNTSNETTQCDSSPVVTPSPTTFNFQNQIAINGTIYIQTSDGNKIFLNAYTTSSGSVIPAPGFKFTPISDTGSASMTYDATNQILFMVASVSLPGPSELIAIDANPLNPTYGSQLWPKQSLGKVNGVASKPLVIGQNVIVVSADGNVYGFNHKDGSPIFTGGSPYSLALPTGVTPALNLVTLDSNGDLNVPASNSSGTTTSVYTIHTDWYPKTTSSVH